jgi:hypothetical protein
MSDQRDHTSIALPGGRSIALTDDKHVLRIADQHGAIELEVELRDTGPVVRVRAAALQVETSGPLLLGCERFELRAREGIRLASDGDFIANAGGDLDLRASGLAHCEGKAVRIRARNGEAQIEAQDDVRLEGERVLLNS